MDSACLITHDLHLRYTLFLVARIPALGGGSDPSRGTVNDQTFDWCFDDVSVEPLREYLNHHPAVAPQRYMFDAENGRQ
jgi:hypothetical protein